MIDEELRQLFDRRDAEVRVEAPPERAVYARVYAHRRERLSKAALAVALLFAGAVGVGRWSARGDGRAPDRPATEAATEAGAAPAVLTGWPSSVYGLQDPRFEPWTASMSADGRTRLVSYRGRSAADAWWLITVTASEATPATTVAGSEDPLTIGTHAARGRVEAGMLQAAWRAGGTTDVRVRIVARDAPPNDLLAVAAEIDALPAGATAQLPPRIVDFSTGVQAPVDPDDAAVARVRRALDAVGAGWRGVERDAVMGDVVSAGTPGDDAMTVAIGRTSIERGVEDPQVVVSTSTQRTVRWWGPHGTNYELTVNTAQAAWRSVDLVALVRSFEP